MLAYGAHRFGAAAAPAPPKAQAQVPTAVAPPPAPPPRSRAESKGLADLVPLGHRAISIQTTDEIAVSNLLQPGDVVDVQLVLSDAVLGKGAAGPGPDRSEARTLLQAVRVVAVGSALKASETGDRSGSGRALARTMTLAMTPEQVNRFTLARSLGSFYLSLRNPAEPETTQLAVARMPDIRRAAAVAPGPARAPTYRRASRPVPSPKPASEGVELIIAGEREVIFPE